MIAYDMGDMSQDEINFMNKKPSAPKTSSEINISSNNEQLNNSTILNDTKLENAILELRKFFPGIENIISKANISKEKALQTFLKIKEKYKDSNSFIINTYFLKYLEIIILNQSNKTELDNFSIKAGFESFSNFLENHFIEKGMQGLLKDNYYTDYTLKSNSILKEFWEGEIMNLSKNNFEAQYESQNTKILNTIIEKNKFLKTLLALTYGDNYSENLKKIFSEDKIKSNEFSKIIGQQRDGIFTTGDIENVKIIDYVILLKDLGSNNIEQSIKNAINIKYNYIPSKIIIDKFLQGNEDPIFSEYMSNIEISNLLINIDKFSMNKNIDNKSILEFLSKQKFKLNDFNIVAGGKGFSISETINEILISKGINNIDSNLIALGMKNKQSQSNEAIINIENVIKYLSNKNNPNIEIENSIDSLIEKFGIEQKEKDNFKNIIARLTPNDYGDAESLAIGLIKLKTDPNLSREQINIISKILAPLTKNGAFDISGKENEIYGKFFETILKTKKENLSTMLGGKTIDEKINQMILDGKIPGNTNLDLLRFIMSKAGDLKNPEDFFKNKNLPQQLQLEYLSNRMNIYLDQINSNPGIVGIDKQQEIKILIINVSKEPNKQNIDLLKDYIKKLIKLNSEIGIFHLKILKEIEDSTNITDNGITKTQQNIGDIIKIFSIDEIRILSLSTKTAKDNETNKIDSLVKQINEGKIDWTQIIYDQTPKNEIQPGSALDKYGQAHITATESSQAEASLPSQLLAAEKGIATTQPLNYDLNFSPNQATLMVDGKQVVIPRNGESSEQFKTKLNMVMPKLAGMPDFMLDGTTDDLAKIFNISKFELNNDDLKQTADKFGALIFNMIDEKINFLTQNNSDLAQIDKLKEIRNEFFAHGSLEGMRKFFNDMKQNGQPIRLQDFFADSESFKQVFSLKDTNLHLDANKMATYLDSKGLYSSMRVEKYYITQHLKTQNS